MSLVIAFAAVALAFVLIIGCVVMLVRTRREIRQVDALMKQNWPYEPKPRDEWRWRWPGSWNDE